MEGESTWLPVVDARPVKPTINQSYDNTGAYQNINFVRVTRLDETTSESLTQDNGLRVSNRKQVLESQGQARLAFSIR